MRSALRPLGRSGSRTGLAVGAVVIWMALAPQALAGSTTRGTLHARGTASSPGSTVKPNISATLIGCESTGEQAERSATFAGEMSTIPGAAKMEMRIDVLERVPADTTARMVTAPGLGVWRFAAPGVKNYRYLKEVTNLAGPAYYRGLVRFRWLNARGKLIKAMELRTARCMQPALPEQPKAE